MVSALLIFWGFYWATDEWLNEPDRMRVEVTAVGPTPDAVVLLVNEHGQILHQGKVIPDIQVASFLSEVKNTPRGILVRLSENGDFGRMISLMDQIKKMEIPASIAAPAKSD